MRKYWVETVVVVVGLFSASAIWDPGVTTEGLSLSPAVMVLSDGAAETSGGVDSLTAMTRPVIPTFSAGLFCSTESGAFVLMTNETGKITLNNAAGSGVYEPGGRAATGLQLREFQDYELAANAGATIGLITYLAGALLLIPFTLSMLRLGAKRRISWPQ